MPIIVVGGIKGGSGKTTLASNLAVIRSHAGRRVLLVDADEQSSVSDWAEHRESLGIETPWTTIQLFGPSVRTQLQKMAKDYEDVIVDTGGRDTTSQRSASQEKIILTIKELCAFKPMTLAELGGLLQRDPQHLRKRYLSKLVDNKEVEHVFPDNPTHPMQAYRLSDEKRRLEDSEKCLVKQKKS